jgi:hypothetical protein
VAKDTPQVNTVEERHVYGSRPLGALVPRLTRPAFRKRAPATAQVLADWSAIVGPAIAAVTVPKRLSAGTLTIACSGPIAMELQHLTGELIGRINGYLGKPVVSGLRFMQTGLVAPAIVPETAALPVPTPTIDLPEGELRDALAALGRAVLTPSTRRRRSI